MKAASMRIAILLFLTAGFFAEAQTFDWPAPAAAPVRAFGSAGSGFLYADMIVGGLPDSLKAAGDGELYFLAEKGYTPSGMAFPRAGLAAIAHKDGFATVYSGIQPHRFSAHNKDGSILVAKGDSIGSCPSGAAAGAGFAVTDILSQQWVNPLLLLTGFPTSQAPELRDVALQGQTSRLVLPAQTGLSAARARKTPQQATSQQTAPQGRYALYIGAGPVHRALAAQNQGPALFRLRLSLNGAELAVKTFDIAIASQQGLGFFNAEAPSSSAVDSEGRYYMGSFFLPKGRALVSIRAESIVGPPCELSWQLEFL